MPVNTNMAPNNVSLKKNKVFAILCIFYQLTFLLGGLNLGFFRIKIVPAKIFKLYSFIICVLMSVTAFIFSNLTGNLLRSVWFFCVITKYNLFMLYVTFIKYDNSFFDLLEELFLVDIRSGFDNTLLNIELKILCSNIAWICIRLFSISIYCFVSNRCVTIAYIVFLYIMVISSELFILSYAFMYFAVYDHLKQFIVILQNAESGFSSLQNVYKRYVDIIEKYKNFFDPTIIISLCCNIPEVMVTFYFTLEDWRHHTHKMDYNAIWFNYITLSLTFVLTLIAPIIAGLLSVQAKRINYILHDKLMQERDERAVWEIRRFISYVEVRSCQFRVYKLIPLDASLVGMVTSFCVTYLIVVIQFTKLY